MKPYILSYTDLFNTQRNIGEEIKSALCNSGILGVRDVPGFVAASLAYIQAARAFSSLPAEIKNRYAPHRDSGETEGYELGAEWFKDQNNEWQIDDKKASYYAFVPDDPRNKWPAEINLKSAYLHLGELIFQTGKELLNFIGLNETLGIHLHQLVGYGRMLHYLKESDATNDYPNWCGAHYDHGVFTGLMPAYYFRDGIEVAEPEEAGLFIKPTNQHDFVKIEAHDKSVLLFQVGEFGQLASHDQIRATEHCVKKAKGNIERYTFALFNSAADEALIQSRSVLAQDARYSEHVTQNDRICYRDWQAASFARYRASSSGK